MNPALNGLKPQNPDSTPRLPLEGMRIIDLTTIIFGPTCTQILGDYGADVIKIEAPDGDFSRHAGPTPVPSMGPMYLNLNRNKRGVCLNLRRPEAVKALLRMCEQADMFISNVRPAALRRLGLGYEDICAVRPDIAYMSLVGYGQDGPYAKKPAVDDVLQAGSGAASLFAESLPGDPAYIPMGIVDRLAGVTAAHAAMAALFLRARTGQSQFVEVPMYETMVATVMSDHLMGRTFEPASGPMGYTRVLSPHRRPCRTKDGFISTVVYTEKHWRSSLPAIRRADLLEHDPRFANATERAKHYPAIYKFLTDTFLQRTCDEWLALLSKLDIPCSKVESLESLLDDPHLASVEMFPQVQHPGVGAMHEIRVPVRWRNVDLSTRRHAPGIGEHTEEVLREHGFADDEIRSLIACADPATREPA